MNKEKILSVLKDGFAPKIVVFGDFCLDKYLYIDANKDELSVETDLVAYQVTHKKLYPGAAGTIMNNLLALGAQVSCVGIVGTDGEGYELLKLLKKAGAETDGMVITDERATCTYTKPMRCENGKETELNRLDFKNFTLTPVEIQVELIEKLKKEIKGADAVLICDQFTEEGFSAVTPYVRDELNQLAQDEENIIFYADSRAYIDKFDHMIIKCNHKEVSKIFGLDENTVTQNDIFECASKLSDYTDCPVYITAAERGCMVYDGQNHIVPAFKVEDPIDVVGAGDACNAGIVYALSKGLSYAEAALVGNAASSLVLKQIGVTGTAKLDDVVDVISNM